MKPGDEVQIIGPHSEAGAIGVVTHVYRANADMERRARVEFHEPFGEGWQTVAARMLKVLNPDRRDRP